MLQIYTTEFMKVANLTFFNRQSRKLTVQPNIGVTVSIPNIFAVIKIKRMKKAFTTHGLILRDKDLAIVTGNKPNPIEIDIPKDVHAIQPDTIFVEGNFYTHDEIEVSFSFNAEGIDIVDITYGSGDFLVEVDLQENEGATCEIKDRNYKLEDLSKELQLRILKVSNEMYADKMKTIIND